MNKQEIAQGLSQFVMMAFIGPQNIGTGFLTRHRIKKMTKEQIMGFSMETQSALSNGNTSSLMPSTGYGSDMSFIFICFQFYCVFHIIGKTDLQDILSFVQF